MEPTLRTHKIIIRSMKMSDISQAKDLNEASLAENYPREYWLEMFNLGKNHSFVAIFAKLVVGYALCNENSLVSFAVDEKYRGKGVGKALLFNCLNTFSSKAKLSTLSTLSTLNKGKPIVSLNVRVGNEVAIKLYKSVGFKVTGELVDYYRNPTENAYSMERAEYIIYNAVREIKVQIPVKQIDHTVNNATIIPKASPTITIVADKLPLNAQ